MSNNEIGGNMKKVIFDCDNTMGIKDCDVDDGLALLYLLGKDRIDLRGITTTYGNSDVETVYANTAVMLQELGRTDIPLFKGCACPGSEKPDHQQKNLESEAATFLVETVRSDPGQISILATGSLTNLHAAFQEDRDFFTHVREIVLMGGITDELNINGRILNELNFSCDPAAAACVLHNKQSVSVITGNNCLPAYFTEAVFRRRLESGQNPNGRYIYRKCRDWFRTMMQTFELDGFHNWDVVAAVYLAEPDLFADVLQGLDSLEDELSRGFLRLRPPAAAACLVNLPEIRDVEKFSADVYRSWLAARCDVKF